MNLLDLFPESQFIMDLSAREKKGAVREIVQCLINGDVLTEDVGKKLERAVHKEPDFWLANEC